MNTDPRITKQKAALKATRDLLTYWAGPPEVALNEKLPAGLRQALLKPSATGQTASPMRWRRPAPVGAVGRPRTPRSSAWSRIWPS